MTEKNQDAEIMALMPKFIDLANELKAQGHRVDWINTALMLASGTYATYLTAGNEGYLKETGVTKLAEAYKGNLMRLQVMKKAQLNPEGKD